MFGENIMLGAVSSPCFTDTTDIFEDGSGVALYTLDYDASDTGGTTGNFNEGIVLNGSNDVSIPGSILGDFHDAGTHAISVSTWVYYMGPTSESYAHVISAGYNQSGKAFWVGIGYSSSIGTSGVSSELYVSGASVSTNWTGTSMPLNQWSHVVFTWTGTSSKLYLNKTLIATTTMPNLDWRSSSNGFRLGRYYYNSNYFLKGTYDQTRIFNRVITQAEINTLNGETDATTNTLQILGDSSCKATYTFDGNLNDLSGNYNATSSGIFKYDGDASNIDFGVGGKSNYGARWNGNNANITINNFLTLTQVGISMWVNIPDISSQFALITRYGLIGSTDDREFSIYTYQGTLYAIIYYNGNNGNAVSISTSSYLTNNTWHHIAFTSDGSTQPKLYIDGVQRGTAQSNNNSYYSSSQPVLIGAFSASSSYNLTGTIDQVRIFNRSISATEVSKLYGNGAGEIACKYTATTNTHMFGCVANYNFDNSAKNH